MTDQADNTHNSSPATEPLALRLSDGLGPEPEREAWEHLKQYGYAPGNYMNKCHRCGVVVIVDKRAITCRPCAQLRHAERTAAFDALKA